MSEMFSIFPKECTPNKDYDFIYIQQLQNLLLDLIITQQFYIFLEHPSHKCQPVWERRAYRCLWKSASCDMSRCSRWEPGLDICSCHFCKICGLVHGLLYQERAQKKSLDTSSTGVRLHITPKDRQQQEIRGHSWWNVLLSRCQWTEWKSTLLTWSSRN